MAEKLVRSCALAALCIVGFARLSTAGPLGAVDDFNTPGLGQYTLTSVLDNGVTEANVSFSDSAGNLTASYAGSVSQPEQVVLLRNDATLAIGETLVIDVAQAAATAEMDLGLAVSNTLTPTAASAVDTDTRNTFEWASVSVRPSQDVIRVNHSINGVITTSQGQLAAAETTVGQLYIQRTTATSFTLGYVDTSMFSHNAITINFSTENVESAIGLYADLRAPGGMLGPVDNLRLVASPLPGDVTGEGMIDLADFDIIKMNLFNTGQTRMQGDLTGDTIVDFADFRQWKAAAGSGFASVSLFGVPEPASAGLLAMGALLSFSGLRRRTA